MKEMDKDHVRDNSHKNGTNQAANSSITFMKGSENKTSQKSTDNSDTILKMNAVEVNPEISRGAEGANNETLAPSEKKSEKRKELFSETTSEEIKSTGSDTYQLLKEENIEEPTTSKPSGDIPGNCQSTEKGDKAETEKEKIKSSKDYVCIENGKKGPNSMSEKSQEDTRPDENVGEEMGHKRQQLTSKDDTSCEEPQNMPSSGLKQVTTTDKGKSGKPCLEVVNDKGM